MPKPMSSSNGLSPRLRGNRVQPAPECPVVRSIPAPAGEPRRNGEADVRYTVYPRACGGTRRRRRLAHSSTGLSPRLRGNRWHRDPPRGAGRSIPAPAGEPSATNTVRLRGGVYPRACGGTTPTARRSSCRRGLSPRLRGNLPDVAHRAIPRGSIPAPAGEPANPLPIAPITTVYPRACGGTGGGIADPQRCLGLSPRLRGNHDDAHPRTTRHRSIPAPAGEPTVWDPAWSGEGVYPRACGGTCQYGGEGDDPLGLSPRLRGNQRCSWCGRVRIWSIPAPAGEPPTEETPPVVWWVYPRACGGTIGGALEWRPHLGLSPRLRGNLGDRRVGEHRRRSIPAPAGEPIWWRRSRRS